MRDLKLKNLVSGEWFVLRDKKISTNQQNSVFMKIDVPTPLVVQYSTGLSLVVKVAHVYNPDLKKKDSIIPIGAALELDDESSVTKLKNENIVTKMSGVEVAYD